MEGKYMSKVINQCKIFSMEVTHDFEFYLITDNEFFLKQLIYNSYFKKKQYLSVLVCTEEKINHFTLKLK